MRTRSWLWLGSACALALGAGCNQALGIEDPTVKESGPPGNESPDVSLDSGPDVSLDAASEANDSANGVDSKSSDDARVEDAKDGGAMQNDGGDRSDVAEPAADASDARRDSGRDASLPDVSSSDGYAGDGTGPDAYAGDGGSGPCRSGPCTPIALLPEDAGYAPRALAQDDTYLYWTALASNTVGRTHKVTGQTTILFDQSDFPAGIAVDDAGVYWLEDVPFTVNRCPKTGCVGDPELLSNSGSLPRAIALDDRNVYWTDDSDKNVRVVPKTGRDGGSSVLWQSDAARPTQITTDGVRLYVTADDGRLYVMGVDGGPPMAVGPANPQGALGVAVDDQAVYWTVADPTAGIIYRAPKTSLTPAMLASSQNDPLDVVSDGTNAYWVNNGTNPSGLTGAVMTCPIAACSTPVPMVSRIPGPFAMVVDSVAVYWVDGASVWKVAK